MWKHLPDEVRGKFLTGVQATGNGLPPGDVVMVAGAQDIPRASRQRLIYVEHGAGQSYQGDGSMLHNRGYHGAIHPANVEWYLAPRQDVADSWGRPAFVAGCPALDCSRFAGLDKPTAVITFHWNAVRLCAEAGTAVASYMPRMAEIIAHLRAHGFDVVGHWHPRSPTMRAAWRGLGVDFVPDIQTVLDTCSMMLCDNSSAMYEHGALDRPVLALNSPEYRRDVHHGLRFWDHVPGWQVDSVDELLALDVGAYWREDWSAEARHRAIDYCYGGVRVGTAGKRAADWLVEQLR